MDADKNPWQILSEKKIYDNNWINVTEFDVINPGGEKGIYGKVHFKNIAIGIVPLDENNNTYLVGQYRFTINQYSWEIPEGGCLNESPLEAAKRELLEETGLKADKWEQILEMYLSNSVTDELCFVFVAKGLTQHNSMPESTEDLSVKKLPFEEVYKMVIENKITDALTIAAILKAGLLINNKKV
jgi:8-oxo-dGTP pyrophosphatase MutT (NUDIX family)